MVILSYQYQILHFNIFIVKVKYMSYITENLEQEQYAAVTLHHYCSCGPGNFLSAKLLTWLPLNMFNLITITSTSYQKRMCFMLWYSYHVMQLANQQSSLLTLWPNLTKIKQHLSQHYFCCSSLTVKLLIFTKLAWLYVFPVFIFNYSM